MDATISLLERYSAIEQKLQGPQNTCDIEVRRFPLSGFPKYIIVYALTDTTPIITRILHGARDPKLRVLDPS